MIIACPRCEASYAVDLAAFGAHARLVQCSACDFRWSQAPAESCKLNNPEEPAVSSPVSGADDSPTSESPSEDEGQAAADTQLGSGLVESEASPAETAVPEMAKDEVADTADEINLPPLAPEKGAAKARSWPATLRGPSPPCRSVAAVATF